MQLFIISHLNLAARRAQANENRRNALNIDIWYFFCKFKNIFTGKILI